MRVGFLVFSTLRVPGIFFLSLKTWCSKAYSVKEDVSHWTRREQPLCVAQAWVWRHFGRACCGLHAPFGFRFVPAIWIVEICVFWFCNYRIFPVYWIKALLWSWLAVVARVASLFGKKKRKQGPGGNRGLKVRGEPDNTLVAYVGTGEHNTT